MIKKVEVLLIAFAFIFIACETNKNVTNTTKNNKKSNNSQDINQEQEIIEVVDLEQESNSNFDTFLQNLTLSIQKSPNEIIKGQSFSSGYVIQALDSNNLPLANIELQLTYPSSKTNQNINYTTMTIHTDDKGLYTFLPPDSTFACKDKIIVSPIPLIQNEYQIQKAKENSVSSDFKVKSNIITTGAVLFVYDFNERNKPGSNSYEVLSALRNAGLKMVGNAPISDINYIGKPLEQLYKANYEYIEDSYGYLIYGTIKFQIPVTATENGYTCTLLAEISAINMKNGDIEFEQQFLQEGTGSNWNNCVSNCKNNLAKQIVDILIYNL